MTSDMESGTYYVSIRVSPARDEWLKHDDDDDWLYEEGHDEVFMYRYSATL